MQRDRDTCGIARLVTRDRSRINTTGAREIARQLRRDTRRRAVVAGHCAQREQQFFEARRSSKSVTALEQSHLLFGVEG